MMKTEKRKANVGERILITSATMAGGRYANGDIATVKIVLDGGVKVTEFNVGVFDREYEVIISAKPKKSARITALETQVAELQAKVEALESAGKYPLTAKFERESAEVDAILADIERKAKPTLESLLATYPTANEQRADVIKRAKAFVGEGYARWFGDKLCNVEFIVNSDKRTVVALLRWKRNNNAVVSKAIAKCDPDDVFNADIGKAIALARALGVEVPEEFVKAVQPTEVVVGHKLTLNDTYGNERGGTVSHFKTIRGDKCAMFEGYGGASLESADGKATLPRITDDTDAVYS